METAVLENTKLKKDAFNTFMNATVYMVRCHGDKLNHPSLVHDDFVRKNKSRVDDYIILNYLLLITHLKIITVRSLFIYMI